jgi:hypothetical protein
MHVHLVMHVLIQNYVQNHVQQECTCLIQVQLHAIAAMDNVHRQLDFSNVDLDHVSRDKRLTVLMDNTFPFIPAQEVKIFLFKP